MKRLLIGVALAGMLTGCDMFEQREITGSRVETFRITDIRQPKHFRVELQNVRTGRKQWESISKHCNRWREVKIGSLWDINVVDYKYPKSQRYGSYMTGTQTICPGN